MSPTALASSIDHLISKRSVNRSYAHFSGGKDDIPPPNFKPHPKPMIISLGTPNKGFFPVKDVTVTLNEYPFQDTLFANEQMKESIINIEAAYDKQEGLIGAAQALEYGNVKGAPEFLSLINEFVEKVTKPAFSEWEIIATTGSGDGLHRVADAIVDEGDVVLMEEFTFTPFINAVKNCGGTAIPVKLSFGKTSADLDVEYLADLLENWDTLRPELKGRKPKAFYTIPTCQNPTGITQLVETRKRVYELASIHDFIIIEDDPYGYLTLPAVAKPDLANLKQYEIGLDDYLENHLYPSYLQFDTVGRVVRLDTFSKIFTPGTRLGWIVAHKNIIASIFKYTNIIIRAPSGVSQMLVVNIIKQKFGGIDGFLEWILKMRLAYTHRRNVLVSTLLESEAHQKGYLRVISAEAGMFASVGLNFPEGTDNIAKMKMLNFKFLEHGVSIVQGFRMAVDEEFSRKDCNFLRISFAPLDDDASLEEASKRIGSAVVEFFENGLEY